MKQVAIYFCRGGLFLFCKEEKHNLKRIGGLLVIMLIFIPVTAKPIELSAKYSIHMLGANIGEFSVSQTNKNGSIAIEATTDLKINLLFSYRLKYVQNTFYNEGIMQSAHVKTYKNGKLNSEMWLKHEKGSYLLITDGDTTIISDSITYSGSMIYFNEPIGIENIYKERSAEMMQISPVSEHVYIIKDEKDREINRYYYEEGVLQYAKMKHNLGTIELKKEIINKIND